MKKVKYTPKYPPIKLHHNALGVLPELNLYDNRFIGCCLLGKDQGVKFKQEKYYPVDVQHYAELCGLTITQALTNLEVIARELQERQLDIVLPNGALYVTSLVYGFIIDLDMRTLLIQWNEKFIPLISGHLVGGQFLYVEHLMLKIPSNSRYCLYLLIEKNLWLLNKQVEFTLSKENIINIMHLPEGSYPDFKVITARFIKPTLKDIKDKLGITLYNKVDGNKVKFSYTKFKTKQQEKEEQC
jgi:hypothetical protein